MDFLGRALTLVRIVETGSLSAAGRSLGLSLPAVSRQVASLEQELGATLLVRTTRRLHLTEEGRRFHAHATRLVQEADAARASVLPGGAIAGTLVVSASVSLGIARIVPLLPRFLAAHPALLLDLRLEDRAADLVGEGIDLAVRAAIAPPDSASLIAQPLATFQRVLVASASYLRRAGTPRTVAALASHGAVHSELGNATYRFVEDGVSRTVTLPPKLRVGTMLARRAAVLAGIGVAVLPDFVVGSDLADGSLRALLPSAQLDVIAVHAIHRVELRGAPRIDAVVTHLRSTMPLPARGASQA